MSRVVFEDYRPGTLSPYLRALLEDAAEEAGVTKLHVVKGSYAGTTEASASTHARGGAFDIGRMWEIPSPERMVNCLRKRGCPSWIRNQQHGGMEWHIHGLCPADGNLHPEAQWQVDQYLNGRDGLRQSGPDYHAYRPVPLVPWRWESDMPTEVNLDQPVPGISKTIRDAAGLGDVVTFREALECSVRAYVVARRSERASTARDAALLAAFRAAGDGADLVAIQQAARAGASEALQSLELTITAGTPEPPVTPAT